MFLTTFDMFYSLGVEFLFCSQRETLEIEYGQIWVN